MKTIDQLGSLSQFKKFVNYKFEDFEFHLDRFDDDSGYAFPVIVNKTQGTFLNLTWVISDVWDLVRSADEEIKSLKEANRDLVESLIKAENQIKGLINQLQI